MTNLSRSGIPGQLVSLVDTIASFKAILAGEGDDLPEQVSLSTLSTFLIPC